jgi:hypothetical protein
MPGMLKYGRDGLPDPHFNVDVTATVWFGMSGSWLRFRMRPSAEHPLTWLVLDGKPYEIKRKNPDDEQSHRVFSLADIEPMAWSLYSIEQADITRARSELTARQGLELAALQAAQDNERRQERNQTEARRIQMADRHPRQRDQLAEKHERQIRSLDERQELSDRRLGATVALVRAEAVLYGILPAEGEPGEALAA